jgi:hypothetical protein
MVCCCEGSEQKERNLLIPAVTEPWTKGIYSAEKFTFGTKQEAEEYLVAVLALSSVPVPEPVVDVRDTPEEDGIPLEVLRTTLSSLQGWTGGPYPSISQKGKVFGINIHDLKSIEYLCTFA